MGHPFSCLFSQLTILDLFGNQQIVHGFAATDQTCRSAFDQNLGGTRTRIVVRTERETIGSGVEDRHEIAWFQFGQFPVASEEISCLAHRTDYIDYLFSRSLA